MPLPVVSPATIQSTLHCKEDTGSTWYDQWRSEQDELVKFLQFTQDCGGMEDMPPQEAFMLGAVTVYKMLKRQSEAEDMV